MKITPLIAILFFLAAVNHALIVYILLHQHRFAYGSFIASVMNYTTAIYQNIRNIRKRKEVELEIEVAYLMFNLKHKV